MLLDLKSVLREEQARMDAYLEKEANCLPESVRVVVKHTLLAGGKRLRPLLAVYMGRLFGCEHPDILTIAGAIEFVHVASLIHDDVLDNAATRRGIVAAHTIYTPTVAILAGDAMLAHTASMMSKIGKTFITTSFSEAVIKIATGEIDEFNSLGNAGLSHEDYLSIITGKTAWSLKIACELPAHYAGGSKEQVEAAANFGMELGIAFQIVDDALDIAPESVTGKPSGGDLRERKCTPLTSFYLDSLPEAEAREFSEKFKKGSFTEAELASITKKMRAMGLDGKTRELAVPHLERAKQALLMLPDTKERKILAMIPDFIKDRAS